MEPAVTVAQTSPAEAVACAPALAEILMACVAGGASVSFMPPLTRDRAEAFWLGVAGEVWAQRCVLLVARRGGAVVGTVQLVPASADNQPHRADVAKMLVHPGARRQGIGAALMRGVEAAARRAGKTVLVLDTVEGGAGERLYARMGWQRLGAIPDYALYPDGSLCATVVFYKRLAA